MDNSNYIQSLADFSKFKKINVISRSEVSIITLCKNIDNDDQMIVKSFCFSANSQEMQKKILSTVYKMHTYKYFSLLPYTLFSFTDLDSLPHPSFVFKYYKNGSLIDCYQRLDSTQRFIIIIGIAYGMKHLHSNNVPHGALKPENVLIDDQYQPLLSSYGLSKLLNDFKVPVIRQIYMTPSSNNGNEFADDILGFSMILYLLLTNQIPFEGDTNNQMIEKIHKGIRPTIPENIDIEYQKLITECWDADIKQRPPFTTICSRVHKLLLPNTNIETINKYINIIKDSEIEEIMLIK